MSHFFISYSREDRDYVTALVRYLAAAGVRVWLDKEIPVGDRWDTVIREKIETAEAVIVVMTPAADDSKWVTNEIHYALAIQKPILPLLLKGDPFFTLTRINHEDVTRGQMPSESFMTRLSAQPHAEPAASPPARHISRPRLVGVAWGIVVLLLAAVVMVVQPWEHNQPKRQAPDVKNGAVLINTSGAAVEAVAFSPDGKIIATGGGNDHTVRLWNSTTGELIRPLVGEAVAAAVAFSPDGRIVVSSGDLVLWNPATGERTGALAGGGGSVAFSPDSQMLAAGELSNRVSLWEPGTGRLVRDLALTSDEADVVESVAFSHDGRVLAAGDYQGFIQLWDTRTGAKIRAITNPDGAYWMSFSPDDTLFVASGVGPVRSWNTATGAQVDTLAEATKAALSPDGKLLATVGKTDYDVRLWDSATGELVNTFVGHTNVVRGLAFSDDGRFLATGGDDQTVRLWKIR